jgi:hypothetical protein
MIPLMMTQDLDRDGIPDGWERDHGLDPNLADDAILDSDRDGLSNQKEFIAGTNPFDGTSVPRILQISSEQGKLILSIQSVVGRYYTVVTCSPTNLWQWHPATDPQAGTGEELNLEVVIPLETSQFFRIRIGP